MTAADTTATPRPTFWKRLWRALTRQRKCKLIDGAINGTPGFLLTITLG